MEHTSVAQVEISGGLLLFVSVSCYAFVIKFVQDLVITILFSPIQQARYRWFSRYVIAAMLVDGKQKIAH